MHTSRCSLRLVLTVVALTLALGTGPLVHADEGPENPGLRGILPDFLPDGLSEDDFMTLGDSWGDWSREVAAEVARFYEDFELDAAGQRESIELLKRKIATMEAAMGDFDYTVIHIPLSRMHARLQPRITLAEAILDTLEGRVEATEVSTAVESGNRIAQAVDDLETWLADIPDGSVWMDYVQAEQLRQLPSGTVPLAVVSDVYGRLTNPNRLRNTEQRRFLKRPGFVQLRQELDSYLDRQQRASIQTISAGEKPELLRESLWGLVNALEEHMVDGGSEASVRAHQSWKQVADLAEDNGQRIGTVLGKHFFNDNLRVVVSENFLSRVAGYKIEETGEVDDFILGAAVTGTQTTTATLSVNLKPGTDRIQFYVQLSGVTQSNTVGRTNEATINTSGYHTFEATKAVSFNGDVFRTAPSEMTVNANNTTTGARANIGGLLGPIANDIALREARRRKGRSEAIAADRVRQRVLPEFNSGIEAQFAKLTTTLERKINPRLLDADLFPSRRSFTSTEDELQIDMRLMDTLEFGGNAANLVTTGEDAAVIHIHESMINNALARLALASLEMTESELLATLSDSLGDLLPPGVKLGSSDDPDRKPDNTIFVFPNQDVLRVKIDDDVLTIVLRTGLKPENGDEIPTQQISIPLTFAVADDKLTIESEALSVSPVDAPSSPFVQIARAGIVKAKMQAALPTRSVDAAFKLERQQGEPVALKIAEIRANSGWLSIVIQ